MDRYVEKRLIGMHNAGSEVQMRQKVITFFFGAATVFLLPYIHIGKANHDIVFKLEFNYHELL